MSTRLKFMHHVGACEAERGSLEYSSVAAEIFDAMTVTTALVKLYVKFFPAVNDQHVICELWGYEGLISMGSSF